VLEDSCRDARPPKANSIAIKHAKTDAVLSFPLPFFKSLPTGTHKATFTKRFPLLEPFPSGRASGDH
jgi:hypothetical protein